MDNFNDDDNEKQSKIQRNSKAFLSKAITFMAGLTVFALVLGYIHSNDSRKPSVARFQGQVQSLQQKSLAHSNVKKGSEWKPIERNGENFEATDKLMAEKVDALDQKVRARKKTGVLMEVDEQGLELTKKLQEATIELLEHRYGAKKSHTKFRIVVNLIYPKSIIKDPDSESTKAHFVIEMAPYDLIPCSVFYFMEIARTYKGGKFHRNAGHVLQAAAQSEFTAGHNSMPFQEYSPDHPHAQYTTGYAGRPSGPGWYVSILDNTKNHGPGSQQKRNPHEADSNFGRVVEGVEEGVIAKIHSVPQNGWLDEGNCIQIVSLTIMANSIAEPEKFTEWKMPSTTSIQ